METKFSLKREFENWMGTVLSSGNRRKFSDSGSSKLDNPFEQLFTKKERVYLRQAFKVISNVW